jgi:hypothetical protein
VLVECSPKRRKPGRRVRREPGRASPGAVSKVPLHGWELVELVLVGRGHLREEGIGQGMGPRYGPGVGKPEAQVLENPANDSRVGE